MDSASLKRPTLIYASLLIILGAAGYLATGMASVTALIPTFFGVVVLVVMMLLLRGTRPATAFWVLFALGVLGLGATVGGIPKLVGWIQGQETARPSAVLSQSIMAIVSAAYLVGLIRLRRSARQARA